MEKVAAAPGPRLLIMNTVQSAAVMARLMRQQGQDVLHLSTALAPRDRDPIVEIIKSRLECRSNGSSDWTLVATSLMEAGVDLSFRSPFRERFAATSLIQIGGRGNRNFEWSEGVTVTDFIVANVDGLNKHLAAEAPADILAEFFGNRMFDGEIDPAAIVTLAMRKEMKRGGPASSNSLCAAETARRYPEVAGLGRVINADTRLVIVDLRLRDRVVDRDQSSMRDLLSGSVQIWANKIEQLGLERLRGRDEIFWWPHAYDGEFLGYMEGALYLQSVRAGHAVIV
jgi:CRISPR-associated endonuclease/helicase Cas3